MTIESVLIGTTLALFAIWFVAKALKSVYRPIPNGNPIALVDDVEWKTGDIVLYHCNPYINITIGGEWSHVGVVVVGKSGMPRIFEITGTDHYCTVKPLRKELDDYLAKKDAVLGFGGWTLHRRRQRFARMCGLVEEADALRARILEGLLPARVRRIFSALRVRKRSPLPKFVGMLCPRRRTVSRGWGNATDRAPTGSVALGLRGQLVPAGAVGKGGTRGAPHLPSNAFMNP